MGEGQLLMWAVEEDEWLRCTVGESRGENVCACMRMCVRERGRVKEACVYRKDGKVLGRG